MKEEKKESPIGILWGWGKPYHGKFIGSIALAVLGVACQMVPYFCVAHIVTLMLSGDQNFSHYTAACVIALCGYLGKVIFSNLSTTISHTATYYTLRDLRENITEKLARVPMGTILDTPSGQYKTTIVDRVEGMEPTFAHLIPEMTANVLVPLVIVVYLFVMDWRMALLSLVTLVVGLAVMSAGMKNYPVKWEGAVKAGKQMANAIVEYIGGIEVVKAFSQSAGSYKKYSDAVNYNANYYVDWMRENQKTMSAYNAILPSVLICVLPCGFAFWLSDSLELSTQHLHEFVAFMYDHFDEFKLILCRAEGTGYADFIEVLVELEVDRSEEYYALLRKNGMLSGGMTRQLHHMITRAYFTAVCETIVHDMPREEAMKYVDELALFFHSGWSGLLRLE